MKLTLRTDNTAPKRLHSAPPITFCCLALSVVVCTTIELTQLIWRNQTLKRTPICLWTADYETELLWNYCTRSGSGHTTNRTLEHSQASPLHTDLVSQLMQSAGENGIDSI